MTRGDILRQRERFASRMTECGAFIRSEAKIAALIPEIKAELDNFASCLVSDASLLPELLINRDILITQYVYLSAILAYIRDGGKSRGSYLIVRGDEPLPTGREVIDIDRAHFDRVCEVMLEGGTVSTCWSDVRPIPVRENWFENVYNAFRAKNRNS